MLKTSVVLTQPSLWCRIGGFGQTVQPVMHTVQPDDASNHCKPSLWEGVDNSTQNLKIKQIQRYTTDRNTKLLFVIRAFMSYIN